MPGGRLVRGAILALAGAYMVLGSAGCCSRDKEKAAEYKLERDDYRAKLIRNVKNAQQMRAQLAALQARLAQSEGRQGDVDELDAIIRIAQFLLVL